ncbi:MAG: GNAT family N-acetyltransferase [Pseudomonadota bacterium]
MTDLSRLTRKDLPSAVALSTSFGWPHTPDDWALMLQMGHGRKQECDGELQGTVMWWPLGPNVASLGMVMVPKRLQGRGIGQELLKAAMLANAGQSLRLTATDEGLPLYERRGFRATGRIFEHQGIAAPIDTIADGISIAGADIDADVLRLDRMLTALDRKAVLRALLAVSEVAVASGKDQKASGFAMCRAFGYGHLIGPVVAPDTATARALIGFFLHRHAGRHLRIDTPAVHGLSDWLETQGLAKTSHATAMRCGPDVGNPVYALASQALG